MATDQRDLRDPYFLGAALLNLKRNHVQKFPLSKVYDGHIDLPVLKTVPDYDHGESLVVDTIRQYRLELKRAAEAGDKHARDTLRGIPNDDPSG